MLLIFLSYLAFNEPFRCHHDQAQREHNEFRKRYPLLEEKNDVFLNRTLLSNSEKLPIRVKLDISKPLSGSDDLMCKRVGQRVSWSYGTVYCSEEDILTPEKREGLIYTFQSLESFLNRLLNVTRLTQPIRLSNLGSIKISGEAPNTDLHVAVVVRPFPANQKMLGAAFSDKLSPIDDRPITGGCYINGRYIPKSPINERNVSRLFFSVIFHELCHVLGISSSLYGLWIDKKTGSRYSPYPIKHYTSSEYRKTFRIITTPQAQRVAMKRTGIQEFFPGIPPGIEIEDGGGSGTEGSHPESRVYLGEVMCGIFVGYTSISEITLALLDDSGWYDVDFNLAEPFAFGDYHSVANSLNEIENFKRFLNGPPQYSYPHHYQCWPDENEPSCSYDFMIKTKCIDELEFRCDYNPIADHCVKRLFVNPMNLKIIGGRSEFDYLYFKVPKIHCGDKSFISDNTIDSGETFSSDSMCMMTSLSASNYSYVNETNPKRHPGCYVTYCVDDKLIISVDDQNQTCNATGDKLTFDGYDGHIECPDINLVCKMKEYIKNNSYYTPISDIVNDTDSETHISEIINPIDDQESKTSSSSTNTKSNQIYLYLIISIGSLVFILVAITIIILYRRRNQGSSILEIDDEDDDYQPKKSYKSDVIKI